MEFPKGVGVRALERNGIFGGLCGLGYEAELLLFLV
jgi:hypothetical protein